MSEFREQGGNTYLAEIVSCIFAFYVPVLCVRFTSRFSSLHWSSPIRAVGKRASDGHTPQISDSPASFPSGTRTMPTTDHTCPLNRPFQTSFARTNGNPPPTVPAHFPPTTGAPAGFPTERRRRHLRRPQLPPGVDQGRRVPALHGQRRGGL